MRRTAGKKRSPDNREIRRAAGFSGGIGLKKLVGGLTFSLGLILVIIAGTELFTGNNLIVIALIEREINLPVSKIFFRAILCNALVCLAVWLCFSARTNTDKLLCIVFPITAFVACGFEHCVANMYFIPFGYALQHFTQVPGPGAAEITLGLTIKNIVVATLGNIIGGSGFVGLVYWFIYSPARKG